MLHEGNAGSPFHLARMHLVFASLFVLDWPALLDLGASSDKTVIRTSDASLSMSQIINLRTVRKQAARAGKRVEATQNAVRHARSKAARALEKAEADKARALLDAHKREP